jgi:hypothetical protein
MSGRKYRRRDADGGRFICVYCARRFASLEALLEHREHCGPPVAESGGTP